MIFQHKTWIWIFLISFILFLIYSVSGILLPFIVGFIIAYALTPAVDKMITWGLSRAFATTLMIGVTFCIIVGLLIVAIPFVKSELVKLAQEIPNYSERILSTILPILDSISNQFNFDTNDIDALKGNLGDSFSKMISWGLKFLADVLTNTLALANLISLIILTPIVAFYMLRDWPKMVKSLDGLFPVSQTNTIKDLLSKINKNMGAYLRGQIVVSLILSLFFAICLSIIGLNYAVTIALVNGLLAFIPFVGTFICVTVALGVAFAQFADWGSIGMVAGVFAVGSVLEGKFLTPSLIGNNIGLHPVWIIFALLAFGSLFGFTGLLLSMPLAAALSVLVRFFVMKYKNSLLYLGSKKIKGKV